MRRSTGCEKCRKRKVRCDEGKPGCQRCSDYGIVCPGYRPPAEKDIHFVDQTSHIVRKAGAEPVLAPSNNSRALISPSDGSHELQWRHQFSAPNGGPTKSRTPSPVNVHRTQLLGTFLDLYLPKQRDRKTMSHSSYIAHLPDVDLSTPLLQISIDTLCLAEIGSLYRDERLLNESRTRYVRALPMLARELARPKARQLRKDHILAAITVLALCELFDAIAQGNEGGQGWISHVNGAQRYIESYGSDILETEFGRLLFHSIRHSSMCMGLVQRKATVFGSPQWLATMRESAMTDPYVALYNLALQVPGILERADRLERSQNFAEDFAQVCVSTCMLRSEMDAWAHHWYLTIERDSYTIVDVRTMKEFSTLCFERLFQTVFSFASVQVCSQHQLYWSCCMLLDYNLLNIHLTHNRPYICHPMTAFTASRPTTADIERDLFVSATSYCRSIPYSCEPEVASIGRIGTFLLRITQSYFEQRGHCNELQWCRGVRRMLESGGHSSPAQSSDPGGTNPGVKGPWNTTHRCKSPCCNFLVRCCAPAPQLLEGEAGYAEYVQYKASQEQSTSPSPPLRQDGVSRSSRPLRQNLPINAYTKPANPLPPRKTEPVKIQKALEAHGLRTMGSKRVMMCCRTATTGPGENGTYERMVLPLIQPGIGPKAVPSEVSFRPRVVLTPRVEEVRTCNLTGNVRVVS